MKITVFKITFFIFIFLITSVVSSSATSTDMSDKTDVKQENIDPDKGPFQFIMEGIGISGGISAGYFYASNPGEDTSDDAFLLSNFLVEISSSDDSLPFGFVGAFGETSTPSILCTPENNTDFKIEYASLTVKHPADLSLEIGLLQPNAGFENTYTFNNKNIILGAVASQQPYNAYGGRIAYDSDGLSIWGGYFKERLDDEEYNSPDYAWEIGLSTTIFDNTFTLYHYNINEQRNLSGAIVERTIHDIDFAFNIDYWRWNSPMKNFYESTSSIGGAVYICPNFSNFSIPIRLEYINQKNSQIYIENPNTKRIYAATISPTWYFNDNTYIRAESAYVKAEGAFVNKDGYTRDDRINLAIELGLTF